MHADYTIRRAQASDLPLLGAIEKRAGDLFEQAGWPPMTDDDILDRAELEAAQAAGRLWVAIGADGAPVGFALAVVLPDDLGGDYDAETPHGHLAELDVHPDHMRRGIGRALVETVCAWARAAGYPYVTLTTERDLPWNAPAYARMSFRIVPPEAWSPAMAAVVEAERGRGLDIRTRVVMQRDVGAPGT